MTRPTALVTGTSRGLGRALARGLADGGWNLVIDARDGVALEQVATDLRDGPRRIEAATGDITDPGHRAELMRRVDAAGRLDAVVLNAGALGPSPLPAVVDLELDALRAVLETNLVAQVALLQLALPRLAPGGRIVAVTSDAAHQPYPGWAAYGAGKAGLEQVANVLAAERGDLRVHRFDPGDLRTDMHQAAFPGEDISDRAEPASAVPALLQLLGRELPSGHYRASELTPKQTHPGEEVA